MKMLLKWFGQFNSTLKQPVLGLFRNAVDNKSEEDTKVWVF
jgi:hypothetical protein